MTSTLASVTFKGLRCKECGHEYGAGARHVCEDVCFGPLEVVYDYDAIRARTTRASIEAGPVSIWRYRDFLPIEGDPIEEIVPGFQAAEIFGGSCVPIASNQG